MTEMAKHQLRLLICAVDNANKEYEGVDHINLDEIHRWLKDILEELK
tara:strand:+ start:971 stop:1111 length:141 start_codon:yes stop_codon:yes gene_type:complete